MTNEALCLQYRAGNAGTADVLAEQNIGFVYAIAREYRQHYGAVRLDVGDYFQEGMLALLRAARQYDEAKGISFIRYAGRSVRNAMLDAIRKAYPNADIVPFDDAVSVEGTDADCVEETKKEYDPEAGNYYRTDPERICILKERTEEVHVAVDALPPRESTWVRYRYGFDGRPVSIAKAARVFHLSESAGHKLEKCAIKRLKKWYDVRS